VFSYLDYHIPQLKTFGNSICCVNLQFGTFGLRLPYRNPKLRCGTKRTPASCSATSITPYRIQKYPGTAFSASICNSVHLGYGYRNPKLRCGTKRTPASCSATSITPYPIQKYSGTAFAVSICNSAHLGHGYRNPKLRCGTKRTPPSCSATSITPYPNREYANSFLLWVAKRPPTNETNLHISGFFCCGSITVTVFLFVVGPKSKI